MKTKLSTFIFLMLCIFCVNAQENYAEWVEVLETTGESSTLNNTITDGENIYINGYYQASATFAGETFPDYLGNNGLVAKLDTKGNLIWASTLEGEGIDTFFDIKLDNDGNILATGWSNPGMNDLLINGEVIVPSDGILNNIGIVAKFSSEDGSLLWETHWISAQFAVANAVKLATDVNGNVYAGGYYSGPFEVDGIQVEYNQDFGNDIYIIKLDSEGNAQWAKTFEAQENGGYATIKAVEANENGLYVGFEYSTPLIINGNPLPYEGEFYWNGVVKMNKETGDADNVMTYGSETGGQSISHIQIDNQNNIWISGYFKANSGFEIGSTPLSGYGQDDGYITKLDPELNVQWAKDMGGDFLDRAFNIAFTADNDILIGGGFDNFTPFQYDGIEIFPVNDPNSLNMFEILVDTEGNYKNAFSLLAQDQSSILSNNRTVILDDGSMYTGGSFNGTVDFTGDNPIFTDHQKGFLMKWEDNITLSNSDDFTAIDFAVYPNPFVNYISIGANSDLPLQVSFFDVSGRLVETKYVHTNKQIDLSHFTSGVYVVDIQGNNTSKTIKIIKK